MVRRRGPPSQGWKTFLRNHTPHIVAIDMFVAPTIGFRLLYGLVIMKLHRRRLVWINVTANPTGDWIARQITEAFPWDQAPRYLIRDRDAAYGHVVTRRLAAMGIRDRSTRAPFALAKRSRRTADRLDPKRMPGPCPGPGRNPSSPNPQGLRRLLQPRPDPPRSCQRRPYQPPGQDDRFDRRHPLPRRGPGPALAFFLRPA